MNSSGTAEFMFGMIGIFDFLHTMSGEDFLGLYVVWFLITWISVFILRIKGFDTPITTIVGLVLFEALGVIRFVVGSAYGMHKWDYMIAMMIAGGLLFVIRAKHFQGPGG